MLPLNMTTLLSTSVCSTSAHSQARNNSSRISTLTVSLTFSVWLKRGNNLMTFHNLMTPLLWGLFTSVNPVAPVAEVLRLFTTRSGKSCLFPTLPSAQCNVLCVNCLALFPPSSLQFTIPQSHKMTYYDYIIIFAALRTPLSTLSPNAMLLGNFNIHMDNSILPLTIVPWEFWISSIYRFFYSYKRLYSGLNQLFWSHPLQLHRWWTPHNWPLNPLIRCLQPRHPVSSHSGILWR